MTFARPLLALLAAAVLVPVGRADPYTDSIAAWRERRTANLVAPEGWLALIGRHPLPAGTHTLGAAEGNAIRLAAGPARWGTLTHSPDGQVTMALADGVDARIDGTTARTAVLVHTGGTPTYVRAGTVNFYILQSAGNLFVRVRDSESPRRKNFAGLDWFPIDPAWRFEAQWVAFAEPREVPIVNVLGHTTPEKVAGKAVFTYNGHTFELLPVTSGEQLFFIFTDETAGVETYEASRFFYADAPKDGKVIVDFNKAYNPPCAFSPFTTCPLPPKENRLPFRVTAGEKAYPGPSPIAP